jgi:hypothetical protein
MSAKPMTIAKVATALAKYDECKAVVSAVSVTHRLHSGLSTGVPLTAAAKEAADIVLGDDEFSTLRAAIEEGPPRL